MVHLKVGLKGGTENGGIIPSVALKAFTSLKKGLDKFKTERLVPWESGMQHSLRPVFVDDLENILNPNSYILLL